jgi:hypothetical protein
MSAYGHYNHQYDAKNAINQQTHNHEHKFTHNDPHQEEKNEYFNNIPENNQQPQDNHQVLPPMTYHEAPLRIYSNNHSRESIANMMYPPTTQNDQNNKSFFSSILSNNFSILLSISTFFLFFRAFLGIFHTDEGHSVSTTLNSSIQLSLYASILALFIYFTPLYSNYFTPQSQNHQTTPNPPSNNHNPSRVEISHQFIIQTDRKLTLFIFFIFNFLIFVILVGMIEDFHGIHQDNATFPITSLRDHRHELHHHLKGHLNPDELPTIVQPNRALHTYLQLYPFSKAISNTKSYHKDGLLKTTGDMDYINEILLSTAGNIRGDEKSKGAMLSSSHLFIPITDPIDTISQYSTDKHFEHDHNHHNDEKDLHRFDGVLDGVHGVISEKGKQIQHEINKENEIYNNIPKQQHFFQFDFFYFEHFSILTVFLSTLINITLYLLTYPYATHLSSITPLLTYFSLKRPTSSLSKWYCGITTPFNQLQSHFNNNSSRNLPKWSYKWFYFHIYPNKLITKSFPQQILYTIINLLNNISITLHPTSLYDVTLLSACNYLIFFILIKDFIGLIVYFEAHIIYPLYNYYLYVYQPLLITSETLNSVNITSWHEFLPICFVFVLTFLWCFKNFIFLWAIFLIGKATWSVLVTLLRSSSNSPNNAEMDNTQTKDVVVVLKELQMLYRYELEQLVQKNEEQISCDKNKHKNNPTDRIMNQIDEKKIKKLYQHFVSLLYERLHVWKLSHNISIITLCLFYNNIIEIGNNNSRDQTVSPGSRNIPNNQHKLIPDWYIDTLRYIIHENNTLGSGLGENSINNGALRYFTLLPIPYDNFENFQKINFQNDSQKDDININNSDSDKNYDEFSQSNQDTHMRRHQYSSHFNNTSPYDDDQQHAKENRHKNNHPDRKDHQFISKDIKTP